MTWQAFQGLRVPDNSPIPPKRRYSVTADVLSFQRCNRQYGYFAVHGYEPAHAVQIYYGTLIHQVLDRAHAHYQGWADPGTRGQLPNDQDIERYFTEVDTALRARGLTAVRAFSQAHEKEAALRRLQLFNRIEGPQLYPRVRDTEHRLQSDRDDYLLHGTVDVLADEPNVLPGMSAEIWDYKGGHRPELNSEDYRRYEFQMLVYAELYKERNGEHPGKAVLYFLGELDEAEETLTRPESAMVDVELVPERIEVAVQTFHDTVQEIEHCRENDHWPAPQPGHEPDEKTCDICDVRWHCPARRGQYDMRYP